ncbi:MAG: hypothetical protein V8S31_11690 [Lachnospiraceae bacterium]
MDTLLDFLRVHGIKTAVATATDEERASRYLKRSHYVTDYIVGATMRQWKPKPDIYLYAGTRKLMAWACIPPQWDSGGTQCRTEDGSTHPISPYRMRNLK